LRAGAELVKIPTALKSLGGRGKEKTKKNRKIKRNEDMKKQLSRLIALGALSLGLFATDNGWANFSGSLSRIPNPESSSGFLGDATVGGWNGSAYTTGWTFARYSDPGAPPVDRSLSYYNKGTKIGGGEDTFGSGASMEDYWIREYYWDGGTYNAGESYVTRLDTGGLAQGTIH